MGITTLLTAASAARMKVEIRDKVLDPDEKVVSVTVCEDDAIWAQIMASPDVSSIRAIPWKSIDESITNYLGDEKLLVTNLEEEIQKLQLEIRNKKMASVSQLLSDDQIQNLVSGSISSEGSYGSLETAKKTDCGKPGKRPRVPADSMEVATDSIAALAKSLLSTGEFKSESGN